MTISIKDNKAKFTNSIINNRLYHDIFGNILLVSLIIIIYISFISYNPQNNNTNIRFNIWSYIGVIVILLIHNKIIKHKYSEKYKNGEDEEFKNMMDNNVNSLIINKESSGRGEFEKDIIKFLK